MTDRRVTVKRTLVIALAAGAVAPAAAFARFDNNPVYFPSPANAGVRALAALAIRVADQIRLVDAGLLPRTDLGPTALKIYDAGGLSTTEPDAHAVRKAASGRRGG